EKDYERPNNQSPLVDLDTYSQTGKELTIHSNLCAVHTFSSFEMNNQRFAYRVVLVPVSVDGSGARTYVGAAFVFSYYDEDGNGTFETRYEGPRELSVPQWITSKHQ